MHTQNHDRRDIVEEKSRNGEASQDGRGGRDIWEKKVQENENGRNG